MKKKITKKISAHSRRGREIGVCQTGMIGQEGVRVRRNAIVCVKEGVMIKDRRMNSFSDNNNREYIAIVQTKNMSEEQTVSIDGESAQTRTCM